MSDKIERHTEVKRRDYPGGTNVQIKRGEKSVSIVRTLYGLWDVLSGDGSYKYTGYSERSAEKATKDALE